jgi:cyclohexyl-isocyanide hydratase
METTINQAAPNVPPLQIGVLVYANMTLLDLAGPQSAFGFHGKTHLVAGTLDPILTDSGITILPTTTYADCPKNLDVLLVPGGFGTNDVMQDEEALAFLAESGKSAHYITSVCSGSVVLAAAGLLDGYKAATHWALYPQLEATGDVEAVRERVVADRNRFTGGGVTAGIDVGLTLLAELRGEQVARMTQLLMEHDPEPPFEAGSPLAAGPELTAMALGALESSLDVGQDCQKVFSKP